MNKIIAKIEIANKLLKEAVLEAIDEVKGSLIDKIDLPNIPISIIESVIDENYNDDISYYDEDGDYAVYDIDLYNGYVVRLYYSDAPTCLEISYEKNAIN